MLLGVMALVTVVVIVSQGCSLRIVTRKVCRFVSGTASNVQLIGPAVTGLPSRSIVSVPVQVPERKDVGDDGLVVVAAFPHAVDAKIRIAAVTRQC
jgi:hypothetical protein